MPDVYHVGAFLRHPVQESHQMFREADAVRFDLVPFVVNLA
jgi:hypothetical protein